MNTLAYSIPSNMKLSMLLQVAVDRILELCAVLKTVFAKTLLLIKFVFLCW